MSEPDNKMTTTPKENAVSAVAASAREEADLKIAVFTARQFPRQEHAAGLELKKACQRPQFAKDAVYRFPRGSTDVEGPSVGLAREAARLWKNIRYGFRVVEMNDDWSHVMGYALDLENNVYQSSEDRFRNLVKRGGSYKAPTEERDLRELLNRRGAIVERNAILKVLPDHFIEEAMDVAKATTEAVEKKLLAENPELRIKRMVDQFDTLSITPAMLEARLKHPLNLTTAKELADLAAVFKSIRDGNSTREECFTLPPVTSGPRTLDALAAEKA